MGMPIFEYDCKECGSISEILVGVSADEPDIVCDNCGSTKLEKKISAANFAVAGARSGARSSAELPPCGASPGQACGHCQYTE